MINRLRLRTIVGLDFRFHYLFGIEDTSHRDSPKGKEKGGLIGHKLTGIGLKTERTIKTFDGL